MACAVFFRLSIIILLLISASPTATPPATADSPTSLAADEGQDDGVCIAPGNKLLEVAAGGDESHDDGPANKRLKVAAGGEEGHGDWVCGAPVAAGGDEGQDDGGVCCAPGKQLQVAADGDEGQEDICSLVRDLPDDLIDHVAKFVIPNLGQDIIVLSDMLHELGLHLEDNALKNGTLPIARIPFEAKADQPDIGDNLVGIEGILGELIGKVELVNGLAHRLQPNLPLQNNQDGGLVIDNGGPQEKNAALTAYIKANPTVVIATAGYMVSRAAVSIRKQVEGWTGLTTELQRIPTPILVFQRLAQSLQQITSEIADIRKLAAAAGRRYYGTQEGKKDIRK